MPFNPPSSQISRSSRFVCEMLTHQEMAPSWVSTHKNMHAKDKPAQPICPTPQQAAFPSDLLRPSPNYRGTSGFPVSLTSNTFLKKKKISRTLLDKCHSGRKKVGPAQLCRGRWWGRLVYRHKASEGHPQSTCSSQASIPTPLLLEGFASSTFCPMET